MFQDRTCCSPPDLATYKDLIIFCLGELAWSKTIKYQGRSMGLGLAAEVRTCYSPPDLATYKDLITHPLH